MSTIQEWWENGDEVVLALGAGERRIFVRRMGDGAPLTLLHGFPSSSHDWAKVAPALAARHRLLLLDLLGFGASEKPVDYDYTIHEQADLVEALWASEQVTATAVVAHDYSVSVLQELLARRAEGRLAVDLQRVVLLNGGLYPDLHRPEPVQLALLDPVTGPQVSAAITEEMWVAALAPTFGAGYDASADSLDIAASMARDDGARNAHRLIQYMRDRVQHADRWISALEGTDVPLSFVWGMQDPVSGAHVAQRIRERLPAAPFLALDDVGHWPPLEAPDRVVEAVLAQG